MPLSTPRAPGRGGALDLNMAPPTAAATEGAGPHPLTGPGTLSVTQVSQSALLEAGEGHLSQDRENDRGGSDRSFTIEGLDAQPSGPRGDLKPLVLRLKLLPERLRTVSAPAQIAGNGDSVGFNPPPVPPSLQARHA